jgi:hypothetical protein
MAIYINPKNLTEVMAVANLMCSNCLEYIEIGDTYYFEEDGVESMFYCEECIINAGLR